MAAHAPVGVSRTRSTKQRPEVPAGIGDCREVTADPTTRAAGTDRMMQTHGNYGSWSWAGPPYQAHEAVPDYRERYAHVYKQYAEIPPRDHVRVQMENDLPAATVDVEEEAVP